MNNSLKCPSPKKVDFSPNNRGSPSSASPISSGIGTSARRPFVRSKPPQCEKSKWKPFEVRPLASASSPTRKFSEGFDEEIDGQSSPATVELVNGAVRPIQKDDDLRSYIALLYDIELEEGKRANLELSAKYAAESDPEILRSPKSEVPRSSKSPRNAMMREFIESAQSPSLEPFVDTDTIVVPVVESPKKQDARKSQVLRGSPEQPSAHVPFAPFDAPISFPKSMRLGSQVLDDSVGLIPQRLPTDMSLAVDASMHGIDRFSLSVGIPVVFAVLFRAGLSLSHIHAHDEEGGLSVTEANLIEWLSKVYSRNYQNCVVGASRIRIDPVPWNDFLPCGLSSFQFRLDGPHDHLFPYLCILPVAFVFGKERMDLALEGPSNREGYPVLEHCLALIPYLYQLAGAQIHMMQEKRPVVRNGKTVVVIQSRSLVKHLNPLVLEDRGDCVHVKVLGLVGHHASRSTGHILIDRLRELFNERFRKVRDNVQIEWGSAWVATEGLYFGISIEMTTSSGMVVRSSQFRNAKGFQSPSQMAEDAFLLLDRFLKVPYCVENQALGPCLVIMALAKGKSRVRTEYPLSQQSVGVISYLECVTGVHFSVTRSPPLPQGHPRHTDAKLQHVRLLWEDTVLVECEGCGFENPFSASLPSSS
eukprot:ANDGO_08546.mRNA.1 putative RNA 3'-terminal phosphate cyclase